MLQTTIIKMGAFLSAGNKMKKFGYPLPAKKLFLFLLFFCIPFSFVLGSAYQKQNSDSLQILKLLKSAKKLKPAAAMVKLDSAENMARKFHFKTLLAHVYIERGNLQMNNDDLVAADSNFGLAKSLFTENSPDTLYLALLNKLAVCSYYLGNNQKVLDFALSGLKAAKDLHNKKHEAAFYNLAGVAMDGLGDAADAINYYQQALAVFRLLNNKENITSVQMNLGVTYEEQKDYKSAEKYYRDALLSARQIKNERLVSVAYNNLANIFSHYKEYRKSLVFSFKSLTYSRKVKDRFTEALTLNNIGDAYQRLKKYDSAFDYYNRAYRLAKKLHSTRTMSISLYNIADIYNLRGDASKAVDYATQSWDLVKNGGDVDDKLSSLKQLEKLYAKKGDYFKAYNFLQQYVTLHDSIYSAKNRNRMEKVRMRYALQAKNQSLNLAMEQKKLFRAYLIASLLALLLVVAFGIFFVRLRLVHHKELKKRMSFVDSLLEFSESYVLILDRNMKITYVSPSYQKNFGRNLKERMGGNPFDYIHPDDIPVLKKKMKELLDGGLKRTEISFRLKKKSGEYRYMQGVFNDRFDNPELNGYVLNFWDITELRKSQQAISESEKKYYKIFNAFPDIYFQVDDTGVITEISPSVKSVTGYEREEALGKTLYDFADLDRPWPRIRKILIRLQHVKDYTVTLHTKSGEPLYCSLNIHELKDEEGRLTGFEGVLRDITDRILAERQLRKSGRELKEANASKDKILSIIGHDLLGPIGTQKSILDMVIDDVEDFTREEILSLLKTMKPSLDATYTMIENLLSWARIMRRSIKPSFQKVNLTTVVENSFDLLQQQAAQKNIRLVYEGKEDVEAVFDKNLIDIVIRNLLSNAIKFSHPNSTIRVIVSEEEKEVTVKVSDEGTGLTQEQIEKILSEKERMESHLGTNKEKGTGLGLVVVKEFIQLNNGKLFIESEPGKGTTFIFTLPVSRG